MIYLIILFALCAFVCVCLDCIEGLSKFEKMQKMTKTKLLLLNKGYGNVLANMICENTENIERIERRIGEYIRNHIKITSIQFNELKDAKSLFFFIGNIKYAKHNAFRFFLKMRQKNIKCSYILNRIKLNEGEKRFASQYNIKYHEYDSTTQILSEIKTTLKNLQKGCIIIVQERMTFKALRDVFDHIYVIQNVIRLREIDEEIEDSEIIYTSDRLDVGDETSFVRIITKIQNALISYPYIHAEDDIIIIDEKALNEVIMNITIKVLRI